MSRNYHKPIVLKFFSASVHCHSILAVKYPALPSVEAEGQVGADRDGSTDTMKRGEEPRH